MHHMIARSDMRCRRRDCVSGGVNVVRYSRRSTGWRVFEHAGEFWNGGVVDWGVRYGDEVRENCEFRTCSDMY